MEQKCVIEETKGNIKIITLNRPRKKNAINNEIYIRVTKILNDAATDDEILIVVLTGTGDFYSSGNDFNASNDVPVTDLSRNLREFINAFIRFPKILIAIVNGPAIGIAATTLPLCDFVFASENAYFYTPFTKLRIIAEGCSTVTFPKLMGVRRAMEMLIMNYKMSAQEALNCGLINYLHKNDELQVKAWDKITEISNLSSDSVLTTKRLIRKFDMDKLLETNILELQELQRIVKYSNLNSKL
ncbi:enoyl-CoA delta isomerase 3, peroxisomal [Vanessa atalanta]|uniref:enoyl-CoA delta isomerase 3, peroxisomal n=1 Tax=Vanessa atalanta TaxID=42275 RepID=UPI001FCDD99D|nr:enoyl-CoA delta isomerase 3, peroxisomal [Vanessa atalanta]XP_047534848.1 enoyl-CoA delta isomerase 3, peroxisomal [Vanessa atalanta]XP_047534849.1 enoyl-CoA delta isomerase 3, peroxisomal [Vanessa atalanta]